MILRSERPFPKISFAFGVVLPLFGCSSDSTSPASSGAPSSASVNATASASVSAVTSSPTSAPVVSASAAPTSTGAAPPSSPEPTLKEWDAAKIDLKLVGHWDRPGCTGRRVREWIRVGCGGQMLQKGEPLSITLEKGFKPSPLDILSERGGSIWKVFPLTEGLDASAIYTFEGGSFRYTVSWPPGSPEPKPVGNFEAIAEPDAATDTTDPEPTPTAADTATAAAPPPAAKPTVTADPLPEEPALEGAPTREEWDALREVGVTGSDARACQTKQGGDWFRVVCRANDVTGKVTSATATKGFDEKQGSIVVGNGSMILVTRFVQGSDLSFDVVWEKQAAILELQWPESSPKPPMVRGRFVTKQ